MKFQLHKVSNHGTGNPAVARLTIQIFELIKFSKFSKQKQDTISGAYFELHHRILKCYEIKERLSQKANEALEECQKAEPQKQAQQMPFLIDLKSESESFLYEAKNILRDLTTIINEFHGTSFNEASNYCALPGKRDGKITKWAEKTFGADDRLTKMLKEDQVWIQEIVKKRNAVEHPGGHSGTLHIKNFEAVGNKIIAPCWCRNDHQPIDILTDMEVSYHNLLTFSEELAVVSIEKNLSQNIISFAEIPEEERNLASPIRFRAVLKTAERNDRL